MKPHQRMTHFLRLQQAPVIDPYEFPIILFLNFINFKRTKH